MKQQKTAQGKRRVRPFAVFIDNPGAGKSMPACDLAPDGTYTAPDTAITAVYLTPLPLRSGDNIYAAVDDNGDGDWSATFDPCPPPGDYMLFVAGTQNLNSVQVTLT
jgi:hypothetical protein